MSSSDKVTFNKNNIDLYLKELAKEYRKLGGKKLPAEVILVGGASVLINYGFRDMTTDIDAIIQSASTMKEAINHVGDKYNLPNGWLNEDFKQTSSFSQKLLEHSEYYKTFYGVMTVRTVAGEYLVAMKLKAGRQYKNDFSDILGILATHKKEGNPLTLEGVKVAVEELYDKWDDLSDVAKHFIEMAMEDGEYEKMLDEVRADERGTKDILLDFEEKHPGKVNMGNADEIIAQLRRNDDSSDPTLPLS